MAQSLFPSTEIQFFSPACRSVLVMVTTVIQIPLMEIVTVALRVLLAYLLIIRQVDLSAPVYALILVISVIHKLYLQLASKYALLVRMETLITL